MNALRSLDSVLALIAEQDPEGRLLPCEMSGLIVGTETIGRLPDLVRMCTAGIERPQAALLVDATLMTRQGQDVKAYAQRLLEACAEVRQVVLSDGYPELHVTDAVVGEAVLGCENTDVVIALGGGTISDIGKLVGCHYPGIRIITVMTAASVDGYTDNVSVMLRDGVKRTVPTVWPDVVLADAETVAEAPPRMNRAGYGEMTSMYVAPADWRLASLAGLDSTYHPALGTVVTMLATDLDRCASGVAESSPDSIEVLIWALALRGIASGVTGTTACLSGVEHLFSHMLDLRAAELGLATGLHGEQVAVGSVVAACIWEMFLERAPLGLPSRIDECNLDLDVARRRVDIAFGTIDKSGAVAAECWSDYVQKLDRISKNRQVIEGLLATWNEHDPEFRSLVRPSTVIAQGLQSAKTAVSFTDLGEAITLDVARWAIANCALMRNRFTVVDLLMLTGMWGPDDIDEVFERVGRAVAGTAAQGTGC